MFDFLKIKAHRKSFLRYISLLLAICVIISGLIYFRMLHIYAGQYQSISEIAFEESENNLKECISKVEAFIGKIYSDEMLLADFMRFFGNDSEEYATSRLNQIELDKRSASFIQESRLFMSEMNHIVKQIVFTANEKSNIISLTGDGRFSLDFSVPNYAMSLPRNDILFGYIYTKALPYPNSIAYEMGKIHFVINAEKSIVQAKQRQIGNVYVLSHGGSICIAEEPHLPASEIIKTIIDSKRTQGSIQYNFLNTYYYINHTSELFGYQFIAYINSKSIMHQNRGAFIVLFSLSITIFLCGVLFILSKTKHDANFLNDIIASIGEAKKGQFVQTEFRARDDEFGIIATELNDMSVQINNFIEKEYILKIQQQKAEMKALQNQINPHFLYNTLEIIRSRALVNNDYEVSCAISNLGCLYRNIVKTQNKLTMRQEIEILSEYLKLMEFKYASNFCYTIDFDEQTLQYQTVKLWMQPIVENFFTHGFDVNNDYNLLLILGQEHTGFLEITFIDNGKKIDENKLITINQMFSDDFQSDIKEPSGLANVYQRLNKFYCGKFKMRIENNEIAGVSVKIKIEK